MRLGLTNTIAARGTPVGGDGLALDLQFAADKTLTARRGPTPILTRGSTGTFVGSDGLIQTAVSGAARFDHDPVSPFACRGLLIEEGRTNLLNGSQTFATSGGSQNNWVDTNITRDGTLRTSPDGTANALRITASAVNGTVISSAAAGSSAARVFSIFLRRVTGTGDIQYTLNNGSTWTTQAITSSWVRYTFSETTANQQVGIRIVTSADAIEIWGAQLEAGSFATSYIPTTTGTLARAADTCSITLDAFSGMFNNAAGTLLSEARIANLISNNRGIVQIDNNTNANVLRHAYSVTDGGFLSFIRSNSDTPTTLSVITGTASTIQKRVIAYEGASFASTTNGAAVATATRAMPIGLNGMKIGNLADGSFYLSGHIAAIRYYKKRLSNAKLITLTT